MSRPDNPLWLQQAAPGVSRGLESEHKILWELWKDEYTLEYSIKKCDFIDKYGLYQGYFIDSKRPFGYTNDLETAKNICNTLLSCRYDINDKLIKDKTIE